MSEVIKLIEAPNMEFKSWDEAFHFLAKNEKTIIDTKKGRIFESAHKFINPSIFGANKHLINKIDAVKTTIDFQEDKYYPIINTTNVLDSHRDVHINGIWTKSAKEKNRKTYYVFDHELKSLSIIAKAKDVEIKVIKTTFRDLGYDMDGATEALTFVFDKDKVIHDKAEIFLSDEEMQNSVRMRYIDLRLCMNSDRDDHKQYLENYNKYYSSIANIKDYEEEEIKYFYAVLEAEIFNEGSLVPLGSNKYTPIKYFNEADDVTSKDNEPPQGTQNEKVRIFVKF
jgi:hypothetical protein